MSAMFRKISWLGISIGCASLAVASEALQNCYEQLKSPSFRERESAQAELLAWSRKQPDSVRMELLKQAKTADDPEVRERCLAVLKELVFDLYLLDGEGFIGISLKDETVQVPGDPKLRSVIRITQVQPGSPGEQAGLKLNDLIVGIEDRVWYGIEPSSEFRAKILDFKPQTQVKLKLLRDGEALECSVKLGRKPVMPPTALFKGAEFDLEALDRASKEAFFKGWLEQNPLKR
jgi:hypothetical protein